MIEWILLGLVALIALMFWLGPRPRLTPTPPATKLPADVTLTDLESWLAAHESDVPDVIEGAEARIFWADEPGKTDLSVLYIHGFSATRQETAPLCEHIAEQLGANLVYARLAGHGVETSAMEAPAEDWLQSMVDSWELAQKLGDKVVIIATSTGAPLTLWLCEHVAVAEKIHSMVFLSPNFKIRNPFGFLLTWPLAEKWVPYLIGREHSWEPENEDAARYWTNRYSVMAVIEMQKVVDWASRHGSSDHPLPLLTIYMEDDPTINHQSAVEFHESWGHHEKELVRVALDDGNPQHVFVGRITAPHRLEWCVDTCVNFINSIQNSARDAIQK